jgi:hypothetical protein
VSNDIQMPYSLAVTFAGCCASGVSCNVPVGCPVAWDGLGFAPLENNVGDDNTTTGIVAVGHKKVRRPGLGPPSKKPAHHNNQNIDAKLNQQLKIYCDC